MSVYNEYLVTKRSINIYGDMVWGAPRWYPIETELETQAPCSARAQGEVVPFKLVVTK